MNTATAAQSAKGQAWDERRTRVALLSSFVGLLIAGIIAVILAIRAADADKWVLHSVEVRRLNLGLLNRVQAAESAERGVLITGDERYLARFRNIESEITRLETRLITSTQDNETQQKHIQALQVVVAQRLKELEDTIQLALQGRRSEMATILVAHLKNNLMDTVQAASNTVDQEEGRLFTQRSRAAALGRWFSVGAIAALLLISGVLGFFVAQVLQNLLRSARENGRQLAKEIQQREATAHQLRQAQKMEALGQLTGGVAHDFNNMLAVIVGNLDILLRRVGDHDARTRRLVDNALEGATRASSLTHRLLAFSRLQPLAPKPLDLNKCISDISEMLRRTLGEHIAIETVLGGGLWRANIDRPQLESAILNLAVNARDAMPAHGGKLTIEAANTYLDRAYTEKYADVKEGQYVMIAVTDTGRGMPAELIAKVFEPFFTTKPVGAGTGLGLSQVHGFIKQSGGHIVVYSEEGVGTTVKLYFPRYIGPLPEETPRNTDRYVVDNRDVTVLVVEDEQGVREFATDALRELGYKVLDAGSVAEALQLLANTPDVKLILTDVVMPDMNGRQLADQVAVRWPHLKVLYMTGYTRNAIVHNGVLDPGTRLLTKPFTLKQLDAELQALLA